ncbi:MAG TPA: AI-2E family transporter, partial [Pyrinomonadaceae bacterium]|nr:AI-2E family transporter [Pyrinomonadaceae bacterium]
GRVRRILKGGAAPADGLQTPMSDAREAERKEVVAQAASTAAVAASASNWSHTRAVLRVVMVVVAVILGVLVAYWTLKALTGVILLVVLSVFFAYLIAPLVELVHRPLRLGGRERVVPRALAIGVVYLLLFGSLGLSVYLLLPRLGKQIADFAAQAPVYLNNAQVRAQRLNELYETLNLPKPVRTYANDTVTRMLKSAGDYTTEQGFGGFVSVLGYVPWLVLIPILAFFLLKDADSFRRSALQMLPTGRLRWRGDEFFQDINSTLAAYIRAQLIACLLIGVICTLGFIIIDVPYALVLGLLAGLLEFIPLVGPLVVAVVVASVTSFYSVGKVVAVLLFLGVLRIVHDYVTYPRIIGSGIHLHPLAVILAILSGHELAGVAGIFLAIPLIAILTVAYRHWLEHRGSEGLVADLLKPADQEAADAATVNALSAAAPPDRRTLAPGQPPPVPAPSDAQPTPSDA